MQSTEQNKIVLSVSDLEFTIQALCDTQLELEQELEAKDVQIKMLLNRVAELNRELNEYRSPR